MKTHSWLKRMQFEQRPSGEVSKPEQRICWGRASATEEGKEKQKKRLAGGFVPFADGNNDMQWPCADGARAAGGNVAGSCTTADHPAPFRSGRGERTSRGERHRRVTVWPWGVGGVLNVRTTNCGCQGPSIRTSCGWWWWWSSSWWWRVGKSDGP